MSYSVGVAGPAEALGRPELCPFCGHPMEPRQHVKYYWQRTMSGKTCHTITLSHMECDACGAHVTTPEQSQMNKRSILAMKSAFPTVLMT